MTDRTRRFSITEEFEIEFPRETLGLGDTLELSRESPDDFFAAHILKKDGSRLQIEFGIAEMMFRNGALGQR